jgi:Inverse autotransporter, beta-domain
MPRRQPYAARLAAVAVALMVLASICAPGRASGAEIDLVQWLTDTAAPALQAAAATNDPALAARESLNRGLSGAFSELQRIGPTWLEGIRLDVSFDEMFQASYAISTIQPLFRAARRDVSIDLHGGVVHDATGRTGGNLGLRYRGQLEGWQLMLGLEGALENRWLQDLERYTIGAELRLSSLEVRASLFDDVFRNPASSQITDRRLDGYDLEVNARLPNLSWAWLKVHRFWQIEASGEAEITLGSRQCAADAPGTSRDRGRHRGSDRASLLVRAAALARHPRRLSTAEPSSGGWGHQNAACLCRGAHLQ